ncbi:hypothetical protein P7D85_20825 [Enterococcus hulanensis]|uniref:Transcriptional regulator n=1 Tax=Enterococcus hulanensis TaxID=2559929 RepID=A0ABU3F4Z8_9ENTE|nr:hypothetical protein [Enterococcus hulanensis]MDT2602209.1 hypothetical protein [Enterococcus hulanensis]MDT2611604.1 hypothetical protein [Enterococcus hulanensis]MDT2618817.1 hypothetical protein [Enterococcus hulanensis]MDT2630281.1 hypothetical protein [Enterococcus hulanensis]MDT2657806.1 hypothetical protein [Enterococcus hulanensis]
MSVNTFNLNIIHQKMCDEFIADIWIYAIQKCMDLQEAFVAARKDEQLNYFYKLIAENDEMFLYVHEELGLDC